MEVFTTTKAGKLSKEDIQIMVALQENAHRLNAYSVNAHRNNEACEVDEEIKPMSKQAKSFFKAVLFYALFFVFIQIGSVERLMQSVSGLPEIYQSFAITFIVGYVVVLLAGVIWAGVLTLVALNKVILE